MARRPLLTIGLACSLAIAAGGAGGQDRVMTDTGMLDAANVAKPFKSATTYSPAAAWNYPSRVYWGDTHLHTSASMDAGAFGNRLGFDEAYRFARGEELTSSTGQRVKLTRPLDFLVIADHSDNMGFFPDAKRFGVTMPPEVPMVGQERAYTSPIWYAPAAS
jgi:hypothetical protein